MFLLGIVSLNGCAMPWISDPVAHNQQQWWEMNKHEAKFIPGHGYAIDGIDGYFDAKGRPITGRPPQGVTAHKPPEDPYDGWLYKSMTGENAQTVTAQKPPEAAADPNAIQPASYEQPATQAQPDPSGSLPGSSLENRDSGPQGIEKFYPSNISNTIKNMSGLGPNQGLARQMFLEGQDLYGKREYAEAGKRFKKAAKRWPDSALEEQALFFQAESEFFSDQYPKANDTYDALVKKYANTPYLDKVVARQFAIARYWQQHYEAKPRFPVTPNFIDRTRPVFDDSGYALAAFDRVRLNDPRGMLADDSVMAAANAFFLKGRYEDADFYYAMLRKDYPQSEHQVQAHMLGLQCKLRSYQGPGYDVTPLQGAEELIDQMLLQFPTELAGERERLLVAKKEVQAQKATRDFEMAQFYDKGEHYRAARFYYSEIVKQYPQSSFADQARARLAQIQQEPDSPPTRFVWLDRIFDPEAYEKAMAAQQGETVQR